MAVTLLSLLAYAALASAGPVLRPRVVQELNEDAFKEAQQRDDTATRAFSGVQIKTSDGRCLRIDELSGDFRANLTPIQVVDCGSTDGEGWDVITAGKHIDQSNAMLVVSTLTQACLNFDPRRATGNQVLLFSCGGRADGGGAVTNSQEFTFNGGAGPLSFQPLNQEGSCVTVNGNVLDIATCNDNDANQKFTFGGAATSGNGNSGSGDASTTSAGSAETSTSEAPTAAVVGTTAAAETSASVETTAAQDGGGTAAATTSTSCSRRTRTVTVTGEASQATGEAETTSASAAVSTTGSGDDFPVAGNPAVVSDTTTDGGQGIPNPTDAVPVSRAGGTLNPTAVAESQQRDDTATRAFTSVEIRSPDGNCLFVDPTAGDFRENLIPVSLVTCGGTPNEKWDVITAGKHNNAASSAIIVSSLMQGCVSFDGRRATGDTVTMFSCGGRADGGGETNSGQLFPFIGELSFAFAPESENNKTCILPGDGRLTSGACPTDGSQLFSIFP